MFNSLSSPSFTNAQALIAPFPSLDYTLMDGAGDDQLLATLEDHLRRRIDERHRLVMLIHEQQEYLRKFTLELTTGYDASLADRDDLNKENDQRATNDASLTNMNRTLGKITK